MNMLEPWQARQIVAIRLNVANMDRSVAFYAGGLGFAVEKRDATITRMSLGGGRLDLIQAPTTAAPYPADPAANDPWFQHFAVAVSDMPAAYARLTQYEQTAISTGGPQQLPPSTGSIIAYKFRDPDGHPLELSFLPGPRPVRSPLFMTINHTALAVADIERSLAFWTGQLGFKVTDRLLNRGPTQWRLDGLEGAMVDIVVLEACEDGPHVELLHYRNPRSTKPVRRFGTEDIAATGMEVRVAHSAANGEASAQVDVREEHQPVSDPDGHLVYLSVDPQVQRAGETGSTHSS